MSFHDLLIIDKPNDNKETQIFHLLYYDKLRFKVKANLKVHPKDWNKDKQEVKRTNTHYFEINKILKDQCEEIYKLYLVEKGKHRTPNKNAFMQQLSWLNPGGVIKNDFEDLFEQYIQTNKSTLASSTIRLLRTTQLHLTKFSKEKDYPLSFGSINMIFFDKFSNYLIDAGLADNSRGKYIKKLKSFLNWATERNYNEFMDYKHFKVLDKPAQIFPLIYPEEYNLLETATLSPRMSEVRDLFLLECYTGLRYCDLRNIRPENFKGEYLIIIPMKSKDQIRVPLSKPVLKILSKYWSKDGSNEYKGEIPKASNQKMNDGLKVICEKAGIKTPCLKITYKGATRIEKTHPKYELISSHTGRQSFITNSLLLKIPAKVIMAITGHKSDKTFSRYIKFTDNQLGIEMGAWNQ